MRKRRSKKEKVFTVPIQFYVTPKQKEKLDRTAEKAGITLSECLRRMIDKLKISEKPPMEFSKMIVELRRIGTNLNQIARTLNANGHFISEDFSSVIDRLNETEDKRLTELIPELQELVDDRRIALGPAVELSYLPEDMQRAVYDYYAENEVTPSYSQANQMKKRCNEGTLTPQALTDILNQPKPNQVEMFRIPADRIRPFLDPKLPKDKMLDVIVKALEYYARAMERKKRDRGAR